MSQSLWLPMTIPTNVFFTANPFVGTSRHFNLFQTAASHGTRYPLLTFAC